MDYAAQLQGVIHDFAVNNHGIFLVISEDPIFVKMLQSALFKQLGIPHTHVLFLKGIEKLLDAIPGHLEAGRQPFIILEQRFRGRPLDQYVQKIKSMSAQIRVIVLTNDITRDALALLFELGVDNTIVKPLSLNTLIEKIANAIDPPARLGKLIEQAKLLLAEGDPESALSITDSILALKPDSASGLMLRGDALRDLGKPAEAILQYQQAMEAAQNYMGPVQRLATHYAEHGDTERELYYLEKLDTLSPLNYERKIDMGKANLVLGQKERAHTNLDCAVRIAGQGDTHLLGEVATRLADCCMGQFPDACEPHLRTIVCLGGAVPECVLAEVWNKLGIALRRQGRWQDAVMEYDKAIARVPRDENLYFNRALAQAEGMQFAAAAESVDKALSCNPNFGKRNAPLAARLGRIFHLAGTADKARTYYELALRLAPDTPNVKDWLQQLGR